MAVRRVAGLIGVKLGQLRYYSSLQAPSTSILRPYQQQCVEKCLESLKQQKHRIAVSLPTGGGKTVIFASLINKIKPIRPSQGHKTLVVVHRKELAEQVVAACSKMSPNLKTVIYPKEENYKDADVIVGMVQSLSKAQFDPCAFKAVIIDEVHHAAAPTYNRILEKLDSNSEEPRSVVVGFSATMKRHDDKTINNAVDYVVYHKSLIEMMDAGWLSDARFYAINSQFHLRGVPGVKDFNLLALSQKLADPGAVNFVAETYRHFRLEHGVKSTLIFAAGVEQGMLISNKICEAGLRSEFVSGSTPSKSRKDALERFKRRELDVLVNCGVFTEGTDLPSTDCVFLARPTKLAPLLYQMIGRGLRKHQDKEVCHIVSFIADIETSTVCSIFGLPWHTKLYGETVKNIKELRATQIRKWGNRFPTLDETEVTLYSDGPEYRVFKKDALIWRQTGSNVFLGHMGHDGYARCTIETVEGVLEFKLEVFKKNRYFQGYLVARAYRSKQLHQVLQDFHKELEPKLKQSAKLLRESLDRKRRCTAYQQAKLMKMISEYLPETAFSQRLKRLIQTISAGDANELSWLFRRGGRLYIKKLAEHYNELSVKKFDDDGVHINEFVR